MKVSQQPELAPSCVHPKADSLHKRFRACSQWICIAAGSPSAFLLACISIIVWAAPGPLFYVINTATIITFLMVFLIQNTQNRDTRATSKTG
jgi:low affinity Fe/Cu permease